MTHLRGTTESLTSTDTNHPLQYYMSHSRLLQRSALLPFEFDTFLDAKTARTDAFYALHNIFQHTAYSEIKVLNVLDAQIKHEMGILTVEYRRSHSLENLQYFTMFLDRHLNQISSTLRVVKARGSVDWPSKIGKAKRATASAQKLQEDFEGLLARALDLRWQCTEGMGVMMDRAVIAESQKAIEQAECVKRLTILATFFIPLSFVTSLFGMNFREFGQGPLCVWLFAPVCVPILLISYVAVVWEEKFEEPLRASVATTVRLWQRLVQRTKHDV